MHSRSKYTGNKQTENYIHYFSHHADIIKSNIVTNMFTRAFRICDPPHLDEEIEHIYSTFMKLAYPKFFINRCLTRARKLWYNPKHPKTDFQVKNNITLPYSSTLSQAQSVINRVNKHSTSKENVSLAFHYKNTIRNKIVRNNNRNKNNEEVGVYCIPCSDCDQCYIGESGRSLGIRLEEHKRACRLGKNYSAVATHTIDVGHRIDFKSSAIVHKSHDRNTRRTVEGALIALNTTFTNNKSGTKEDKYTNYLICQKVNINNCFNISATLRTAASPLFSQVSEVTANTGTPDTGAYAVAPARPSQPEPPDDATRVNTSNNLRRSSRLARRT